MPLESTIDPAMSQPPGWLPSVAEDISIIMGSATWSNWFVQAEIPNV